MSDTANVEYLAPIMSSSSSSSSNVLPETRNLLPSCPKKKGIFRYFLAPKEGDEDAMRFFFRTIIVAVAVIIVASWLHPAEIDGGHGEGGGTADIPEAEEALVASKEKEAAEINTPWWRRYFFRRLVSRNGSIICPANSFNSPKTDKKRACGCLQVCRRRGPCSFCDLLDSASWIKEMMMTTLNAGSSANVVNKHNCE